MSARIHTILLKGRNPHEPVESVAELNHLIREAISHEPEWIEIRHELLATDPRPILQNPVMADLHHAGLSMGTESLPWTLEYFNPAWMPSAVSRQGNAQISWRLHPSCMLIRTAALLQFGLPQESFQNLCMAWMAWCYRASLRGLVAWHQPELLQTQLAGAPDIPLAEEFKFAAVTGGKKWLTWSSFRAAMSGKGLFATLAAFGKARALSAAPMASWKREAPAFSQLPQAKVSIVIATLNRYPYLHRLLPQLAHQTIPPLEILIIDDTPEAIRDSSFKEKYPDLPIQQHFPNSGGQSSARNYGIQISKGDYVLFMDDDDDEVTPTLLEQHLRNIQLLGAAVSSGEHDEIGAPPVDRKTAVLRISDGFPTINTMVDKRYLKKSGLFDGSIDKGQSEDHDLGMRLFLAGGLLLLDPGIRVLHNRAPIGGLRTYKNRVITFASSRKQLLHRRFLHPTEVYITMRYYPERAASEYLWLNVFSTFVIHRSLPVKLLRFGLGIVLLPFSIRKALRLFRTGRMLIKKGPRIPALHETSPAA